MRWPLQNRCHFLTLTILTYKRFSLYDKQNSIGTAFYKLYTLNVVDVPSIHRNLDPRDLFHWKGNVFFLLRKKVVSEIMMVKLFYVTHMQFIYVILLNVL